MKKKLLYILHGLETGGVEMAVLSAIPLLSKEFDLRILVLGKIDHDLLHKLDEHQYSTIMSFDFSPYLYPFKLSALIKVLSVFEPDIMITSLWRSAWIGSLYKKSHPKVKWFTFLHNTRFFHTADRYFNMNALNLCDEVLVDSLATLKTFNRLRATTKKASVVSMLITHTPKVIDINVPNKGETVRFLFLGRLHTQKNLPLAVQFVASLKDFSIPVRFDIYGRDDGDRANVRRAIAAFGMEEEIHLKGDLKDVDRNNLFSSYHFYLQFSKQEGMAMSVVEAMQHGLVCLLTPVGEIPTYSADGISALYLQHDDIKKFGEHVKDLVDDPRRYEQIATQAHKQFVHRPIFADSLLQCINNRM